MRIDQKITGELNFVEMQAIKYMLGNMTDRQYVEIAVDPNRIETLSRIYNEIVHGLDEFGH